MVQLGAIFPVNIVDTEHCVCGPEASSKELGGEGADGTGGGPEVVVDEDSVSDDVNDSDDADVLDATLVGRIAVLLKL